MANNDLIRNQSGTVMQRPGDPYLYLKVMGEWYCYNPAEPPIGGGSMGTVYKGFRCSNSAEVAIKKVKEEYANISSIRKRAFQEASLAFRHDNLIEMLGYCEWERGYGPIWILSNFVKGSQIGEFIRKEMPENASDRVGLISRMICSITDALAYVHSRGVIHRDIKPSNIMVEINGNVRLMDLGIARMNGGNQFSTMGFIGTPQYAAPEQIIRTEDSPVQINQSTDVYELGITFYELLTGSNPFDCPTEADTLVKQMKEKLPYNPKIPKAMMKVIWRATEKEQGRRFQSAYEFKKGIEDALKRPPTLFEKIWRYITNCLPK